jgi:hypothetical protein
MANRTPRRRGTGAVFSRSVIFLGFVFLLMSSTTGCAGKSFAELRPGLETRGRYIEGVPFFRQSESTCGPAALAGVFAFHGKPESLDRITAKVYLPELRGTLPMDMETFAREAGFTATSLHGTLAELKAFIRKGTPVICMLDLGFGPYHKPHYISVHDGLTPNSLIGYEKFNAQWTRAGRWMLVIE